MLRNSIKTLKKPSKNYRAESLIRSTICINPDLTVMSMAMIVFVRAEVNPGLVLIRFRTTRPRMTKVDVELTTNRLVFF